MSDEGKYEPHHETKPADVSSYGVVAPKEEVHAPVESTDRGLFGFGGKKKEEEKCEDAPIAAPVESTDRGLFGFGKKKEEEKCEDATIAAEFEEKVQVSGEGEKKEEYYKAPEEEKKHESLAEKLHRSNSSSSSSSDEEEVGEDGLKKKKKKGLKGKITEKISGEDKTEAKCEDTSVPVEKYDAVPVPVEAEEKKGFLEKIKEKLPGGKKPEEVAAPPHASEYSTTPPAYSAPPPSYSATTPEGEGKEKKGFMDKIKEKLPGYHPKTEEEKEKEKEKEKDAAC